MAPNRGIAAHFATSKPSISRSNRSSKSKSAKDAASSAGLVPNVAHLDPQDRTVPSSASVPAPATASSLDTIEPAAESSAAPTKSSTSKKPAARRQTRTRLRTPDEGEVDRIMAENQSLLEASPSRFPLTATTSSDKPPLSLLGTPPAIPRGSTVRNARFSPLLEPTTTSPISVRTDPDTNKMFLLLPKSPSKPAPSTSTLSPSPTKRKLTTPPKATSPTKTPRTLDGTPRRLITGEPEAFGTEEEDGLVLTPGRAKGTRVQLGSPSKSPLLARLGDTPKEQALRRIVDEDEEAYITPRGVRQRAKGLPLPPMATQNAAAVFRGAQLPASSSTPSLLHRKVDEQHRAAAAPSLFSAGLIQTETEDPHTDTAGEELELPTPKHVLSQDLPLPSFYSSLMTLHMALEHALVVHLATAGCSSATLQSTSAQSGSDSEASGNETLTRSSERKRTKVVRLPNLISYATLRPLVERSGGRRLGPTELKRLASVWVDFQHAHAGDEKKTEKEEGKGEEEEVRGLGFIISKTRSMDPRTGRRAPDWGIGIELEIKRTVRARTPPTEVGFGGVHLQSSPLIPSTAAVEGFDETVKGTPKMPARFTTPPPSPSSERTHVFQSPILASPSRGKARAHSPTPTGSPKMRSSMGAAKAREGMSVVAMWNNGLETRKAEVGRRLRERCARFHQLWLDEKGISVPVPASVATAKQKDTEESAAAAAAATRTREQRFGLGLGLGVDSDVENNAVIPASPPPPREVMMGAGGLLTPSATRSGGRRIGKRIFHIDPAELDARTLSEEEDEEEEEAGEGEGGVGQLAGLLTREEGKKSLIDEVSQPVSLRSSKSTPHLRSGAVDGEVPEEGAELRNWHPDFPLNDPKVVKPVPLANLPSLTAPLATPHRPRSNKDPTLDPLLTPKKPVKFTTTQPTALLDRAADTITTPVSTAGMSLRERIAAKEQLRRTASLPSLVPSSSSSSSTPLTPMQALSQRALVSRLPELSSILFMLFSNGTTLSSTGITRSPTIPMHDLLAKLSKSVKIQLSARECRQALDVLARIAPGFLVVIDPADGGGMGGKEYVRLGQNAQTGTLWRLNEVRARIASELNGK